MNFSWYLLAVSCAVNFQLSFGLIIMDSGNPARFIRGAFLDVNQEQPHFVDFTTDPETDLAQDKDFVALAKNPGFMQTVCGNIVTDLDSFNKEMTNVMIVEAKEISARSCLNMCQFSRARMSALQIMNILQAVAVRVASIELDEHGKNKQHGTSSKVHRKATVSMFKNVMDQVSSEFVQMEQDLHQYDAGKHGEASMRDLAKAMKHFESLKTSVKLNEEA